MKIYSEWWGGVPGSGEWGGVRLVVCLGALMNFTAAPMKTNHVDLDSLESLHLGEKCISDSEYELYISLGVNRRF